MKQICEKLKLESVFSTVKYILLQTNFLLTCCVDSRNMWFVKSIIKKGNDNKAKPISMKNSVIKRKENRQSIRSSIVHFFHSHDIDMKDIKSRDAYVGN